MTDTCGRMIIELIENGTSRPVPRVAFDPVGRFTPGLIHDNVPYFAQEIERAQARVRHAAAQGVDVASSAFIQRMTTATQSTPVPTTEPDNAA